MADTDIDWAHWRTFQAVIQCGTLSGASRHLRLAQPTVGRHIGLLEEQVGAPLFTRSQKGLAPTDLALSLAPHTQSMESMAETLKRVTTNHTGKMTGTVRLAASEVTGAEILVPELADLRTQYPDITFEIHLGHAKLNLLLRDADIALRMTEPTQSRLISKKVSEAEYALFAHRDYIVEWGIPNSMVELFDYHLIGFDRDEGRYENIKIAGRTLKSSDFSVRSDNEMALFSAIRSGLGIGACPVAVAAKYETLVPILPEGFRLSMPRWLVMHEDMKTNKCIRTTYEHLAGRI